MKKTKRMLAILAAMMMSVTACSGQGDSQTAGNTSSGAAGQAETGSEAQASQSTEEGTKEHKENLTRKTKEDTFTWALNAEPNNLDPQATTMVNSGMVQKMIFDTLITSNGDGTYSPCLATEWEYTDDTTLSMTLRDDVYFHNGEKMTAEDVAFTIQRAATMPATLPYYKSFDEVNTKAIDDTHVEIKFKTPFAPALNYLSSVKANIVSKKAVEEMGDEKFARNPVGTGAFVFKEWVTGDHITCERNEQYWGEKPSYKTSITRFITEDATRSVELEAGGVDGIGDVFGDNAIRLSDTEGCHLIGGPGMQLTYFVMYDQSENFKDVRVRQALAMGVDMKQIVQAAYKGSAKAAESSMADAVMYYQSQGGYEYNPEKAKELLKEAGKEDLHLTLVIVDMQTAIDVAQMCQAMWSQIGVTVDIEINDQPTVTERMNNKSIDFTLVQLTAATGDPDHVYGQFNEDSGSIQASTDETFNRLLQEGRSEMDQEKRAQIYGELQKYIHDNVLMIPIAVPNMTFGVRDYVDNLAHDPGNMPNVKTVTFK